MGVDIFFALSSFLITWLLLEERATSRRIGMPAFYARRSLRLISALVDTCAFVLLAGAIGAVEHSQASTVGE